MYTAGSAIYMHQYFPNAAHTEDEPYGDVIYDGSGLQCFEDNDVMPCGDPAASIAEQYASARSRHGGGVVVVFGDRHTQFVANEVNLRVWRAVATIDGGEDEDLE